jgi:hypothetical protein
MAADILRQLRHDGRPKRLLQVTVEHEHADKPGGHRPEHPQRRTEQHVHQPILCGMWDPRQVGSRPGGIQEWWDLGREGSGPGGIRARRDLGQVGSKNGGI